MFVYLCLSVFVCDVCWRVCVFIRNYLCEPVFKCVCVCALVPMCMRALLRLSVFMCVYMPVFERFIVRICICGYVPVLVRVHVCSYYGMFVTVYVCLPSCVTQPYNAVRRNTKANANVL